MPRASTESSRSTAKRAAAPGTNAIELLTTDHQAVQKLFKRFEELRDSDDADEKEAIAKRICNELTIHAQIEEEIFYPAARDAVEDDGDLLNEAEVEHQSAKDLIAQIEAMDADDEMFDATVKVLGEYVNHHIQEEQNELFPKVRQAKLDLDALGAEMANRKEELSEELGVDKDEEEEEPEQPRAKGRTRS